MWAFSIGTSIGWGSFIVTCNAYLQKSGILGTAFGLLVGMAVVLVVTWNLQYMICKKPDAGGIYAFERSVGGRDLGFLALWFILLTYFAVLWANMTSVPLFVRFFLGRVFQFGFHYSIFGYEVWMGEVLLSMGALVLIGLLCVKGTRFLDKIMSAAALLFSAGFAVCAIVALFRHGNTSFSYNPLYTEGSSIFAQVERIAAISPWAFIGFENITHFSEEFAFPVKKVKGILIGSVIVTTLLYLFVSLLSVSAYPAEYGNWIEYIRNMGNLDGIKAVPAFYAAYYYLGNAGVTVLMISLFCVIFTSLIGNMFALSRLIFAAGREGEAPEAVSKLDKNGVPSRAIWFIVAVSLIIPIMGRTAIGWIVDVTTLGATIIYALVSYAVFKHAKQVNRKGEQYTGIAGMVLMVLFILLLLIPGLLPFHAMETESYILFIIWAVLGLAYFRAIIRKDSIHQFGQRVVVWIILLVMVLFASMMWVSRATESAANNAVQRIFEYHESHPADDSIEEVREQRVEFLQNQASEISKTNTLYSIVSMGLFVIIITMMLNNYRDTQKLGKRLTEAEKEAEASKEIAKLKDTIVSLLDNMPGMTFTKDAKTGIYLACNQSFANYAHKKTPDGVVGLTDEDIFDEKTAEHFVSDDKVALSINESYVFYEDVLDGAGNRRQFQTTKLKYVDINGRLCILGMCRDVTDFVKIKHENATTKEAYEKARSTGLIYSHIAQSLAHGYARLYYVNLDTDDYIQYRTSDEDMVLTEFRRGIKFFVQCRLEAPRLIYADDCEVFLKAMDKETLLSKLARNNTFVFTFRALKDNKPVYVSMRITKMDGNERFMIIGVTNIDDQMKQRQLAQRVSEEQHAYTRLNALTGDFICVYVVDPQTDRYHEFSSTEGYEKYVLKKEGSDFFNTTRQSAMLYNYPDDLDRFLMAFSKKNILEEIEESGIFSLNYRIVMEGKPVHVLIKAAYVEEKEGKRLVVGLINVDSQVRQEAAYAKRLAQAQKKANVDALTRVKNRHAYLEEEEKLNLSIESHSQSEFAIVIMDVNDLKKINDTQGHHTGDKYLKDASKVICGIFRNSSVFRIGGDEFVAVVRENEYPHIDEMMENMREHNEEALKNGGVVIACGMSRFEDDDCVATVFDRADQEMYENKMLLKGGVNR